MDTTDIIYKEVMAATVKADNSAKADRPYNISAELHIDRGKVGSIANGLVTGTADPATIATFGENPDGSLWLTFIDTTESTAVLQAIIDFIAATRTKTETDNPVCV